MNERDRQPNEKHICKPGPHHRASVSAVSLSAIKFILYFLALRHTSSFVTPVNHKKFV